jgi:hypothetical protein
LWISVRRSRAGTGTELIQQYVPAEGQRFDGWSWVRGT